MGKFRFIATAAFDDHCSTSSYHGVHYFRYLPKCNENGTFTLIKFLQNVGKVEILGAEVKMEKTSKIIGDLEAIANERVGRTLGKILSIDSMIPLGYRSALCRAARPGFYRQAKHDNKQMRRRGNFAAD